jgi:hypothetical protein
MKFGGNEHEPIGDMMEVAEMMEAAGGKQHQALHQFTIACGAQHNEVGIARMRSSPRKAVLNPVSTLG